MEWQEIKTAPRGKRLILYFPEENTAIGLVELIAIDTYPMTYPRWQPTHWMPLPDPPAIDTKQEQR